MHELEAAQKSNHRRAVRVQSGAARAAVLGVSDGLVTNIALILGVAGADPNTHIVRLAGIASLAAGAFSMAVGEYISMRAQRELLENILAMERDALSRDAEAAQQVLAELFTEQGVAAGHARDAAMDIAHDPEKASAVYARGRLGINPDELGSPYSAAASSLVTFSAGALVPLAPWFFLSGGRAEVVALVLTAVAAAGVGGYLGYVSGISSWKTALRQLVLLLVAAGVTYAIGLLLHTTIS